MDFHRNFQARQAAYLRRGLLRAPSPVQSLAGQEGFEPPSPGFGDRCSSRSSYWPNSPLLGFPVRGMAPAVWTVLFERESVGRPPLVLSFGVIAAFARTAGQRYYIPHNLNPFLGDYSTISLTTPAPTVRPPSRMAKRSSFSMATGVMRCTSMETLSPGITISTPSGSFTTPVTSVVRR